MYPSACLLTLIACETNKPDLVALPSFDLCEDSNQNSKLVHLKEQSCQSYPLLPLGGVLNQDFKLAFKLNLTHGFFSSAKHKGESRCKTNG